MSVHLDMIILIPNIYSHAIFKSIENSKTIINKIH